MKKIILPLILAALFMWTAAASAQTAQEMTKDCTLSSVGKKTLNNMTDGRYTSYWSSSTNRNAYLDIEAPQGQKMGSVYIQFFENAAPFDVQTPDEAGNWQTISTYETGFLAQYVPLDAGYEKIRIRPKDAKGRLFIIELHVFAEGDAPDWVQKWEPTLEKADLLALAAHPDDEILFLGGTIPYYAGEKKMKVQVAYLVPTTSFRRLELLDGLWLCGVKNYPIIGHFPDQYQNHLSEMYEQKGWSRQAVVRYVVGVYRACRPDVVVTQDVNGEYGHGAHRAAADAAQAAVTLAADPNYQHEKLEQTEPWQISKLYLHLYDRNPIRMDWRQPLEAFGGKTAFDIAEEAFACHISQQTTRYHVEDFGEYDNSKFGLAFTNVGLDEEKNDFFEHVGK